MKKKKPQPANKEILDILERIQYNGVAPLRLPDAQFVYSKEIESFFLLNGKIYKATYQLVDIQDTGLIP